MPQTPPSKDLSKNTLNNAVLVAVRKADEAPQNTQSLIDELEELCKNLGIVCRKKMLVSVREFSPQLLIGSGKAEEIIKMAEENDAKLIVFDNEISPTQQRNWEKLANICVIDRHEIILEIFARRAKTKEATLQVELAKLEYSLPRLKRAWNHFSRQRGGGVTQRGEGESQLELDQRRVRERIAALKKQLLEVKKQRNTQRKRRQRLPMPTAAIVGYTNAGKSSLLNALSNAGVLAQDKLFATLDPTTRRLKLSGGQTVLLTDTVGFVRNLPHQFVEAFKSTLEEAVNADFLIHLVDCSTQDAFEHIQTTNNVLKELGIADKESVLVFNKCDKLKDDFLRAQLAATYHNAIFISAKTRANLDSLLQAIEHSVNKDSRIMRLKIPRQDYSAIAALHKLGAIRKKSDLDYCVELTVKLPSSKAAAFEKYST
ncbi:MAG: GTPase HflX [Opitutales bacterium]|nr:GTPase HflX [Opitutales bacterium]